MSNPAPGTDERDRPEKEPIRSASVWIVYLVLLALAIPWYWPSDFRGPILLGFPVWTLVSLGAVFLAAVWTTHVLHRHWRDTADDSNDG